jgi:dGTPase
VFLADRIAYINHDLNDALRAGVLSEEDLPEDIIAILGKTSRERINTAISSVFRFSNGKNTVAMEQEVEEASERLRSFMFERVYLTKFARSEEGKAERMLSELYDYFLHHLENLPETFKNLLERFTAEQVVCDYLSSMTDRFAIYKFNQLFVPKGWTFGDELR